MSLLARLEEVKGEPIRKGGSSKPFALLVDCSGSMGGMMMSGESKWNVLARQVRELNLEAVFSFDHQFIPGLASGPGGSTDMAMAFKEMRKRGLTSFVMITDGMPDDEQMALHEAARFTIEIIYVGPEPRPRFLDMLASRCRGRARSISLDSTEALPETMKSLGMGRK